MSARIWACTRRRRPENALSAARAAVSWIERNISPEQRQRLIDRNALGICTWIDMHGPARVHKRYTILNRRVGIDPEMVVAKSIGHHLILPAAGPVIVHIHIRQRHNRNAGR